MIKYFLLGIAFVFFVKYIVFGLDAWNSELHPGRVEPEYLRAFFKPLLGVFG